MKSSERVAALRKARQQLRSRDKKIARMKQRLDSVLKQKGIELPSDTQEDLSAIIQKHHSDIETLPMSDFRRVFWNQQVLLHYILPKHFMYLHWHSRCLL